MATSVTYNDFRYGKVSEYVRRRVDLAVTQQGVAELVNATPMKTGGVRLRPGMKRVAEMDGVVRIIPFVISVSEHYILALSKGRLTIWQEDYEDGSYENISGEGYILPYQSEDEIRRTIAATSYDTVVLANRDYPPYVIRKGTSGGFSCSVISLVTTTDRVDEVTGDDGEITETPYQYDYEGLFTTNNYPSTAAFIGGRLWFACTKEFPYRFWASRPSDYFNFQMCDYYETVDESVTTEQYLKAIEEYTDKVTDNGDGTETRVTKTVSAEGYVTITTGTYDKETDELIGEVSVETFYYTKPVSTWNEIAREDCAFFLDLASNKDEHIQWISSCDEYVYMGTASTEYALPETINAVSDQTSRRIGSYGSADGINCVNGDRNIFYIQSGKRRLRTISAGSYSDLTAISQDILSSGATELHWQKLDDPRLFAVLKDGTLAVLCYDIENSIQGWSVWESELAFKSLSVVDIDTGQRVLALVGDEDGSTYLEEFVTGLYTDDGKHEFHATLETNNIDSTATIYATKKSYAIYADSMQTRFKVGTAGSKKLSSAIDYSKDLIDLYPYAKPGNNGLRIRLESYPGEEFILLALIVTMEVN